MSIYTNQGLVKHAEKALALIAPAARLEGRVFRA